VGLTWESNAKAFDPRQVVPESSHLDVTQCGGVAGYKEVGEVATGRGHRISVKVPGPPDVEANESSGL